MNRINVFIFVCVLCISCERTKQDITLSFKNVEMYSNLSDVEEILKEDSSISNIEIWDRDSNNPWIFCKTSLISASDEKINGNCVFDFRNKILYSITFNTIESISHSLSHGIIKLYMQKYGTPQRDYQAGEGEEFLWEWKNQHIRIFKSSLDVLSIQYKDITDQRVREQYNDSINKAIKLKEQKEKAKNRKIKNNQDI